MGDFMGKRLALLAIRILVSVNLLHAAIFLKFAGVPGSVALFTRIYRKRSTGGYLSQHSGWGQEPSRQWRRSCS
jgi:hypothetical protein